MKRWLLRGAGIFLTILALIFAGSFLWLRTSLPDLSGEIRLAGLEAEVRVIYDENSIPHIYAGSANDAYRTLGFVHARDRLFQMDIMRRIGAGRLSEVIGPATLVVDRTMRTMGIYRLAGETYRRLPEDVREHLESYAAGVNAFLDSSSGAPPPEFLLLRYEPEKWTPPDSLVWGRLMAQTLTGNWRTEALRAALSDHLPPERLKDLWPEIQDGPAPTVPALQRAAAFESLLDSIPEILSQESASNLWAVSGAHTVSGKPHLANDPHLGFRAPGLWYLVRLKAPGLDLTGATVAGVPFHVLGHNDRIAWALTSTGSDTQDLFVERVNGSGSYDTVAGPRPFLTRSETIQVRGEEPVEHRVRETVHGPVISDVDPRFSSVLTEGEVIALASVGLRPDDLTPLALLRVGRANNWQEFRDALTQFHSPQQNFAYSDVDGNIGLISPGRVPIRPKGQGRFPVPGWSGEHDWTGFIPFDELPQVYNPPSGRIFNANHALVGPEYRWHLADNWEPPYRARRIESDLERKTRRTLETEAALQMDSLSLAAKSLLPVLLSHLSPDSEETLQAAGILSGWDFQMSRNTAAPLLFTAWLAEANRGLYGDEIGKHLGRFLRLRPRLVHHILKNRQEWCDDVETDEGETCSQTITRALKRSIAWLRKDFGRDMEDWRWGEAHVALFSHPVLGRIPVLKRIGDIRVEADGGAFTVNRGQNRLRNVREPFASVHGAGYRAIYDLADLSRSLFAVATGPSGNPLSSRYDNTTEDWRDGKYFRIAQSQSEATRNATGVLRLLP